MDRDRLGTVPSRKSDVVRWAVRLAAPVATVASFVGLAAIAAINIATVEGQVPLGPFGSAEKSHVYLFGEGVLLLAAVLGVVARRRSGALERENESLRRRTDLADRTLAAVHESELRRLATRIGFYTDERITLFLHEASEFTLVARYSTSPPLRAVRQRKYPDDQGCLGRAWARIADSLVLPDPNADMAGWLRGHATHGLDEATARALTMRSRTYHAFRIETAAGKLLGAIVFESHRTPEEVRETGALPVLNPDKLLEIMKGEGYGKRLESLLDAMSLLRSAEPTR